jgi:hypothetical protein
MRAACSVLIVGILDDDDEQARIETEGVGPAAVSCPPPIVDIAVVTSLGPHETCRRLLAPVGRRRRPTPRGDDLMDRTDG